MCTIGNVFTKESFGLTWNSVFKQCDLTVKTDFIEPVMSISKDNNIRYAALTRLRVDPDTKKETTPAWSGVNEYGVSFVAADSYLPSLLTPVNIPARTRENFKSGVNGETVFDMYQSLISDYTDATSAKDKAVKWYNANFTDEKESMSDILLVADANQMYFLEVLWDIKTKAVTVLTINRTEKYFCSTNHMRMIYGAQPYEENHSTYLRLARAEAVLNAKPSHEGVGDLLRDKYYGDSVWSICRSKNICIVPERPYCTQASVIFNIPQDGNKIKDVAVEYIINNDPSVKNKAQLWRPFTGTAKQNIEYIGQGGL